MSRYYCQGKQLQLSKIDFKAQGGEGSIYVKGSTAYKIYSDPRRTLAYAKLQELALLTESNIVRPLHLLFDKHNQPVGYAMRNVGKTHALSQLFPKAFRQRNNLTPEMSFGLVRKLQAGVSHIHSKHILLVDLNELNFLVADDFSELYFIDVDSYQTPSFPATVLMESVRDRHAKIFTEGSDWFSFAVVSFQMFVGIHPFKGSYPQLQQVTDKQHRLDARMRANISVLHKGVTVPGSTLPFAVIPSNYLDWYRAIFEDGKRLPPPNEVRNIIKLSAAIAVPSITSDALLVSEYREFDSQIIWHDAIVTITEHSVYFDGRRFDKPAFDVKLAISPRQRHLIASYIEGPRLRFRDLSNNSEIGDEVEAEGLISSNGQFFLKQHESILAVDLIELQNNLLLGLHLIANVMMSATQIFEGVIIQNLLGAKYASVPGRAGACYQIRLTELDNYQILNARIERNVLIIVGTAGGRYDKFIYRFADDFARYVVRTFVDVTTTDINFTVLDNDIVLDMSDEGKLEIFSRHKGSANVRVLEDPFLQGDVRLFHVGKQAFAASGHKLFKISLKLSN